MDFVWRAVKIIYNSFLLNFYETSRFLSWLWWSPVLILPGILLGASGLFYSKWDGSPVQVMFCPFGLRRTSSMWQQCDTNGLVLPRIHFIFSTYGTKQGCHGGQQHHGHSNKMNLALYITSVLSFQHAVWVCLFITADLPWYEGMWNAQLCC